MGLRILNFFVYAELKQFFTSSSVILRDPPCKDDNARFTMVLLKALSDHI